MTARETFIAELMKGIDELIDEGVAARLRGFASWLADGKADAPARKKRGPKPKAATLSYQATRYPEAVKRKAAELASRLPVAEVARRIGTSATSVSKWVKKYGKPKGDEKKAAA